jgi:multidrug efflux pump subunit AcrB
MTNNKANKLVLTAVENPYLIIVICLFVIILGSLSLIQLPKDLLPVANMPAVQILSFYSGMPVRDVEENLTSRFERYTAQAIGIKRQESKSLAGVSIVKNFFNANIDLNTALTQTSSLVMSVLSKLPPGTQPPLILPFDPMSSDPLALVAVAADKPIEKIYDTARYNVRNTIQAVRGAMAPTIMGGMQRQVTVYLDNDKLNEYNFSLSNVLDKLSHLNSFVPAGDVKIDQFDYQILSNGLVDEISDMNEFPLRSSEGVTIYLKDVGHAKDTGQIQTNIVLIDGKEQVYVPIYREPGGNSLSVVQDVKAAIANLEKALGDTKLTLISDQSIFIRHAIDSISEEAILGGGLAALMIFLFLGNPASTVGILLSLPLSLLFAFIGLMAFGQTINAMTLGGLALSIGVLVDNSIVVLENISKKLEEGKSSYDAAVEGASEVALPIFTATLSTLAVLFPVVFLSGIVEVLFTALAKSVILIMIGSYLAAMTVMPLFASHFLKANTKSKKLQIFVIAENFINNLTNLYGRTLSIVLEHHKAVIASAVAILILGIALAPFLGTELFPRADSGGNYCPA